MPKDYVQLTTGRVAYSQSPGTGPDLVLLHSNSTCGDIFVHQLGDLGNRARVTAIDLPGHGGSDDLTDLSLYGLVGFAEIVGAALERLGIAHPLVMGTSLGGHIVLEMTRSHAMAGAMIVGTPPYSRDPARIGEAYRPDPVAALSFVGEMSETQIAEFADALSDGQGTDPMWRDAVRRTDPNMRRHLAAGLFDPAAGEQRALAENCPVQLAIVNGAEDRFIDLDYVDRLAYANLWSGRTYRIEGAGHAPFFSRPEAFNALLGQMAKTVFGD